VITPIPTIKLSEKVPDAALFDGIPKKLPGWLADVRMKFIQNQNRFPIFQSRVVHAFSRLGDGPKKQIVLFVKADRIDLADAEDLFKVIRDAYDDPDRKGTALRNLRNFQQKNKRFQEYYADFQRYVSELNYNNDTKKGVIIGELFKELADAMVTVNEPDLLEDFVKILMKVNNKLYAR